jgi:hypothetical protein
MSLFWALKETVKTKGYRSVRKVDLKLIKGNETQVITCIANKIVLLHIVTKSAKVIKGLRKSSLQPLNKVVLKINQTTKIEMA